MIEHINDYVAEHFRGVGTTRGSFVRIHVWAVVFLVLASVVASNHGPGLASRRRFGPVENVALGQNDQRAFSKSAYSKKYFHIAWIAGSETEVFTNPLLTSYVPRVMLPSLPKIDGRPVVVDLYYLPAMRLADDYFSLLDALAEKPDMVVMSLNPVWVLNPLVTHQWMQLDAKAAADLVTRPSAWPIAASYFSPADLAWGLAAKLKPIANRSYYSGKIHKIVDDLGPLDRAKLVKIEQQQRPDRSTQILNESPLQFLAQHRLNACYPTGQANLLPTRCDAAGWAGWMKRGTVTNDSLNKALLSAIGRELKRSKIPSYVYLAQINSDWLKTSPAIQSATAAVEKQLTAQAGKFRASNILFQPKTVSRFATGLSFLQDDPVHLHEVGTLAPYIAGQLCHVLAQSGDTAPCTPSKNGNADG